jgi:hypothetical protein
MSARTGPKETPAAWTPIPDPPELYSSGIPDFDRLLGGGFRRGSFALFQLDSTIETAHLDLILQPTLLNFLYQSRGIIAVLPARDSPHAFRARLTRYVTRRRFDGRVRIVQYVSEDEGPYVVHLKSGSKPAKGSKARNEDMAKMEAAEKAVMGLRRHPFLELNGLETAEMLFGAPVATRMFFPGIKRAKIVGNLMIGLLRPGLQCAQGVQGMADTEFALHHDDVGLILRGIRPAFPAHVVTVDLARGPPYVSFVPRPSAGTAAPARD